jgi:antitoxin VapB
METAKIFMDGENQVVQLPEEYHFEGSEVYIKKVGNTVVLVPFDASWETLFDSLELFSDDFMQERDQPELQLRYEGLAKKGG